MSRYIESLYASAPTSGALPRVPVLGDSADAPSALGDYLTAVESGAPLPGPKEDPFFSKCSPLEMAFDVLGMWVVHMSVVGFGGAHECGWAGWATP